MTLLSKAILFALVTAAFSAATAVPTDAPWAAPRTISSFQSLLDRSPFSLPTAEESSPLADRFSLTGAASLDGEALVFVVDKTTQTHHMLSKIPNKQNMGLVEYLPDPDPRRMRATIRVDGQVATIAYAEASNPQQPMQQPMGAHANGAVPLPLPTAVVNPPPGTTVAPGSPAFQQQNTPPPNRRVIRRRTISGQPTAGQ